MARIDDGFATTITFTTPVGLSLLLWEKTVTPPGVEAGGETDITTMRNTAWRTKSPKKLKSLTNAAFTAAYDPQVFDEIVSCVGVNQLLTITFPDASTIAFWGWLDTFTPNENTEGEQPTAACTIIPSNHDDSDVEVAPVLT
jgi:hypothetical protein